MDRKTIKETVLDLGGVILEDINDHDDWQKKMHALDHEREQSTSNCQAGDCTVMQSFHHQQRLHVCLSREGSLC
jgi:hypothetical protein